MGGSSKKGSKKQGKGPPAAATAAGGSSTAHAADVDPIQACKEACRIIQQLIKGPGSALLKSPQVSCPAKLVRACKLYRPVNFTPMIGHARISEVASL